MLKSLENRQNKALKVLHWMTKKIWNFLTLQIYIRLITESCFFSFIYCFAEALGSWPNVEEEFSYVISWMASIILFLYMQAIPIIYYFVKKRDSFSTSIFKELFSNVKHKSMLSGLQNYFFILRRFLMSLIIILMRDSEFFTKMIVFISV
jgi:hypothetical protein